MPIIKDMRNIFMNISKDKKYAILFILFFSLACLKLCASQKKMTPEEARDAREKIIEESKEHVGKPYAYAKAGPSSFDCSGFVYYVFRETVKIQLPRTADGIYKYCTPIKDSELEAGDLVFFETTSSKRISHVGIYLGNGDFISAISDGGNTGVQIRTLLNGYWKNAYYGAARLIPSGIIESDKAKSGKDNSDGNDGSTEERRVEPRSADDEPAGSVDEQAKNSSKKGNKTVTVEPAGKDGKAAKDKGVKTVEPSRKVESAKTVKKRSYCSDFVLDGCTCNGCCSSLL